jgi:holo-[acyl-carrier protein] synthase
MVGVDIVLISRVEGSYKKYGNKFLSKYLTKDEISLVKTPSTAAGFWAVKEAFSKALKCGISSKLKFSDIIIYKDDKNAPFIKITNYLKDEFDIKDVDISIAHDGGFAIAVAVVEKNSLSL